MGTGPLLLLLGAATLALAALPEQPPGCSELRVSDMYNALPYPPRDPSVERPGRVAHVVFDDPVIISHVGYGGTLDWHARDDWRLLVAGGGTGDATVQLAVLLDRAGVRASITQVDLSLASLRVAERRLAAHSLSTVSVQLVQSSLLDADLEDGSFDYINCVGVLHHTENPGVALRVLERLLKPGGLMQLGVYGALGRRGIYDVREMLRLLGATPATPQVARDLLAGLPDSNWLRRNEMVTESTDLVWEANEGVADMLLNPCDVAYTLPQLQELVASAGLRIHDAVVPAEYSPLPTGSAELDAVVAALPLEERWRFAELQRGTESLHGVFLVRPDHPHPRPDDPVVDADAILCAPEVVRDAGSEWPGTDVSFSRRLGESSVRWTLALQSFGSIDLPRLPPLAPIFVLNANCENTLAEMWEGLRQSGLMEYDLSWAEFQAQAVDMVAKTKEVRLLTVQRVPFRSNPPR